MEITNIRIIPANEEKVRAFVTITIDNFLAVHDIKIIQGERGLFMSMPGKKMADGKYKDIVHPISSEARAIIESAVFAEYEKVTTSATP